MERRLQRPRRPPCVAQIVDRPLQFKKIELIGINLGQGESVGPDPFCGGRMRQPFQTPRRHLEPADFFEPPRSEEHTSELQSLMRHSYAVFCLEITRT